MATAWVTPLVVAVDGLPEPAWLEAYLMTIVLGQLVLHGVRFTTPSLSLNLSTRAAGDAVAITAEYETLPGRELTLQDEGGIFAYKRLADRQQFPPG